MVVVQRKSLGTSPPAPFVETTQEDWNDAQGRSKRKRSGTARKPFAGSTSSFVLVTQRSAVPGVPVSKRVRLSDTFAIARSRSGGGLDDWPAPTTAGTSARASAVARAH